MLGQYVPLKETIRGFRMISLTVSAMIFRRAEAEYVSLQELLTKYFKKAAKRQEIRRMSNIQKRHKIFHLRIVTMDGKVFDDQASQIFLRTIDGDVAIRAGHINYCEEPQASPTESVKRD